MYRIFVYTYAVKKQPKTTAKFSIFSTNIYIENLYVCTSSGLILSRLSSQIRHAIIPRLTYLQVQKCLISVPSTILHRTLPTPFKQVPRASGNYSSVPRTIRLLRNIDFHCRIHDSTLLVIIFSEFNPVYTLALLYQGFSLVLFYSLCIYI